jgi:hypothetical protein
VKKLVSYYFHILFCTTWKLPELKELPFLKPDPYLGEKGHLLFGHLFDTLTATFLYQSLHELALRNTVCKKKGGERENFSLNDIHFFFFLSWWGLNPGPCVC